MESKAAAGRALGFFAFKVPRTATSRMVSFKGPDQKTAVCFPKLTCPSCEAEPGASDAPSPQPAQQQGAPHTRLAAAWCFGQVRARSVCRLP